jgi:NADPH-dependent curcumin reductase CurA
VTEQGPGGVNRRFVLRARPEPEVTAGLFALEEGPIPEPGAGQLLIRVIYLSLDPAMRGWIAEAPNYRDPVPLGAVMAGFTVGEVAVSRHPGYAVGEIVCGAQGWQEWALSDGSEVLRKVDPALAPISTALHVLGHTGLAAYVGLLEVGRPKPGETVVVSTAAGAVGSMVGQIARIKGCRSVGITGGPAKVAACREDFGYDAAIDYRATGDLGAALAEACPAGIDVYFDNVGGPVSDAVLEHINVGARIVVCGTMGIGSGETTGPRPNRQLLVKRARMEGFLVLDHMHRLEQALADLAAWLRDGRLRYREDVAEGLDKAPEALLRLLAGGNSGKMLVRVGPEPS